MENISSTNFDTGNNKKNMILELIQENIPLADKNWFKAGGPAKFFAEPKNSQEFQEAINFANNNNLEIFILGEGANILISDDGFDGLVIRPKLTNIKKLSLDENYDLIQADAGVSLADLINWCLNNNLTGLEEFSGIPGTVGGSVYINIHYFEFLLSQFLVSAEIINKKTAEILLVEKDWFNFGYNQSTLHEKNFYLVNATFKLKKTDELNAAYNKGRSAEIIRHRQKRYPNTGTCGSFFRNFYENEVTLMSAGKKLIFVAYYLDKIGVKGQLKVGDAIVSYQHANMLVNQGNATTQDIINLARQMQDLVFQNYQILPQAECQMIGFKQYPLKINK